MKRLVMLAALALGAVLLAAPVQAGPKPKLPGISGGGVIQNDNSGLGSLLTVGGFTARATAAGVAQPHAYFGNPITVYAAKGQVQAKNVLAADPSASVGSYHGQVVCIANLGPSAGVDGGGDPAGDVWEIRFQITQARDADNNKAELPPFPVYGSYFVQDNGAIDYQDENFGAAFLTTAACGVVPYFELELQLNGNISVQ